MKIYGLPYMGSKNFYSKLIVRELPKADNFYDIFCGGGAILERALETKKYKNYFVNEINPLVFNGLKKAFNEEYLNENRWVSKEDFYKLNLTDFYVYSCFSFGYRGDTYSYGSYIEPWKKAHHYALFFGDYSLFKNLGIEMTDCSPRYINTRLEEIKSKYINWYIEENNLNEEKILKILTKIKPEILNKAKSLTGAVLLAYLKKFAPFIDEKELIKLSTLTQLKKYKKYDRLENYDNLKRLQKKKTKENVIFSNLDYRKIEIKDNSVVYCDPPYLNTEKYKLNKSTIKFNHEEFYKWCAEVSKNKTIKLFISEYYMPGDKFKQIRAFAKINGFTAADSNRLKQTENLYIPINQERNDLFDFYD